MENKVKTLSQESIIAITAVLAVIIPLAIFATISLYSSSHALTEIIRNQLEEKSALIAYDINTFIIERITDAKIISQADVLESGDITAKIQYATEIVAANKWINDIDILNPDGKIIASSGMQNEQGQLFWKTHHIFETLYTLSSKGSQGDVYISEATILDAGPGILVITPITDDSNTQLIGLLTLEINLKNIARMLSSFNNSIAGKKYIYIVNNNGKVIISDDPSVEFLDNLPDLTVRPELLDTFATQEYRENITYTDITGTKIIAGYSDMPEFGINQALDWGIIAIAPVDKITAPVTDLKQLLLVIGTIIAALSTFIAYRIVIIFTRNLSKIATQADAISQGIYSGPPLAESKRQGAFNTLVIAFNQMKTNIKRITDELKDREKRLDITLNSIGDGVIATDEKGNITRMNPAAQKLTGWNFKEAHGQPIRNIFIIIDELSRKLIENPVDKVLATGQTIYLNNLTTLISKDGIEYKIEDSAAAILNEDDIILGMILIFSDVTKRKLAEEQYRQAMKMDALGKLTGGVAHDYNNMLGVIIGYSDLLKDELKDQPKLLKFVDTIKHSAERGAALTKKLLDFSRHKKSDITLLNLNNILLNQQLMLQKTLTARINLEFDLGEDLWSVRLNEGDTIDAILNISINAMHAMKESGHLIIRTRNEKIDTIDANTLKMTAGDYVSLSISDTGCGIDPQIKNKIYDPFFSTKGEKGTGLGLSQVYGFVRRSHGVIKLYSELGHGTRQMLYFPRHHEGNKPPVSIKRDTASEIIGSETILVVDDEPDLLEFCSTLLNKHGFNVLSANSVKNALHILEHNKVDLLLSDIIMPEKDGYQLAAIVKEKYPDIIIQLASGFADNHHPSTVDETLKNSLLSKPYNSDILLQTISELLNKE
ncbi:MAG: response regulator [Gammaproteobacteria bacterium]|nr:response regulator [Gammaproteobacteria bacterium]